ncbi:hypothetical protein SK128_004530, partial [Halocaridina rubra]
MKRPTASDQKWTAYTKQFQWDAWLVIAACLVAMAVLLYMTAFLSSLQPNLAFTEAAFIITQYFLGK